jgi:hypothetical protein
VLVYQKMKVLQEGSALMAFHHQHLAQALEHHLAVLLRE